MLVQWCRKDFLSKGNLVITILWGYVGMFPGINRILGVWNNISCIVGIFGENVKVLKYNL
jgi:hypothetical protein